MVKVFRVGGAVRDQFLNRPNKDVDFAVEAESYEAMKEYIVANGGKIYLETPEFFTIRGKIPNPGDADFVLCRKDGQYSDGRRPDSVSHGTIIEVSRVASLLSTLSQLMWKPVKFSIPSTEGKIYG